MTPICQNLLVYRPVMDPTSNDQTLFSGPPPDANPPLQIFGNYAPDGSLIPPSLPGPMFPDDGYGMEDGHDHDQGDPKRRRIARVRIDPQK